jgi:hypothetical protein
LPSHPIDESWPGKKLQPPAGIVGLSGRSSAHIKIAVTAFAATLSASLALVHVAAYALTGFEHYRLSHWSVVPCVMTAWLAALLAYHLRGDASPHPIGEQGPLLLGRIPYLPARCAYDSFLDVLVLLAVADPRHEHDRLAWIATIDEQWSRLYDRSPLAQDVVVSIRAELVRVSADAFLARLRNRRCDLEERDHQILMRVVFLLFAATGPMSLKAAEMLIEIAKRLGIPFAYLTAGTPPLRTVARIPERKAA